MLQRLPSLRLAFNPSPIAYRENRGILVTCYKCSIHRQAHFLYWLQCASQSNARSHQFTGRPFVESRTGETRYFLESARSKGGFEPPNCGFYRAGLAKSHLEHFVSTDLRIGGGAGENYRSCPQTGWWLSSIRIIFSCNVIPRAKS